ncbi:MAG: VWA domain-containing protein [Gammaproteobacteria bacterium]|nr:VWA domain-containing protein [Gammaproteobacteria bacterium]
MGFSRKHRFSAWDGSQEPEFDPEAVMKALADDLIEYGDLTWAVRNLMSRGMQMPAGEYLAGLRDMIRQLQEQKQRQLKQFNLNSIFSDIRKRLDEIVRMERSRIEQWKDKPEHDNNFSDTLLKDIAQRNDAILNNLPHDTASRIKHLEKFEFINPEAQKKFIALLNELRSAVTNTFFKDIESMVKGLADGDVQRLKEMVKALNNMLSKNAADEDPEFDQFMQKFGDMFGNNPPQSLQELLEQMCEKMAAAQSLMNSMSPQQRQSLEDLLSGGLGDSQLEAQLAKLAKELDILNLHTSNQDKHQYNFSGQAPVAFSDAMQLMQEMHELDDLIEQMQAAEQRGDLSTVDKDLLRDLLGDDEADQLDKLEKLMKLLEQAGYLRSTDENGWELTPRGSRMIGQQALGEIYARLKNQNLGNHAIPREGSFGERMDDTKRYEFGDPFHLHMPRTLRNAINRNGQGAPIKLQPDDFEIYRSEVITSTATVMLVDLSWSMALRGSFMAAKKVALALHNLITSQYPRDSFYIIGFAAYAKELKAHELPYLQWDEYQLGTNMQHALLLAERLLRKHPGGSKQIIMISDGEPTSHLENGEAIFAYPPTPETIRATFRAVKHCTTKGIAINTFMLEQSEYLRAFMQEMARINGGRVFYTSPDQLGEYILVDYVENKRKKISR